MKKTKKFLIYKITCILNNKIYIGQHRTNNENDEYMGSGGKLFQEDFKKFGKENFKKEIVRYCENEQDLNEWENKIVNKEFVARDDTYNCQIGGQWSIEVWAKAGRDAFLKKLQTYPEFKKEWISKINTKETIKKRVETMKKHIKQNGFWWTGKRHNQETKNKIGAANAKHQKGSGNSQYGTCWIYNEDLKENKKIIKTDLDLWLTRGWIKGRKIKNG